MIHALPAFVGRLPRWLKIVLLQVVLWPLLLLSLELAFRVILSAQGEGYSAQGTRAEISDLLDRSVNFVPGVEHDFPTSPASNEYMVRVLHPFTAYTTTGGLGYLDMLLKRQRTFDHSNEYNVWVLGGSVAQMFGSFGRKPFIEALGADVRLEGKTINLYNFGEGGYKQPQQAILLVYLLSLGMEPDAVINLDGYNEVALGSRNLTFGTHSAFPSIPHWGSLVTNWANDRVALDHALAIRDARASLEDLGKVSLEWHVHRSAILGRFVLDRMKSLAARRAKAMVRFTDYLTVNGPELVLGGPGEVSAEDDDLEICRMWYETSTAMHGICRANDVYYMHALQPNLYDEGAKVLSPKEQARVDKQLPGWLLSVRRCYPKLREWGQRLSGDGVVFVDLTRAFLNTKGPIYSDNCHYNKRGNRIFAEQMAEAFLLGLPGK